VSGISRADAVGAATASGGPGDFSVTVLSVAFAAVGRGLGARRPARRL